MSEDLVPAGKVEKPEKGKRYTPAEVDQILLALIENGGVLKKTYEQTGVSMTTLKKWREEKHVPRYNELLRSHGNDLKIRALAKERERLGQIDAIQEKGILALETVIDDKGTSAADLAKTVDALTRAKKGSHEAIASMENRPTIVQHEFNGAGALKRLADAGLLTLPVVVEATAEEIKD